MATIPFNFFFCLLAGLSLCACARTQLISGAQPWRADLFGPILSFAGLTAAPVAIYLYVAYPDWSWMYLINPARLPRGTGLAVVVATTLMVPAGYLLGWALLRLLSVRGLFGVLGAVAMGLALGMVAGERRFFFLGRYEDFLTARQGAGPGVFVPRPLTQGKLGYALPCIVPLVLSSLAVAAYHLWAQGRWLRQQAAASLRSSEHRLSRSGGGSAGASPKRSPSVIVSNPQ